MTRPWEPWTPLERAAEWTIEAAAAALLWAGEDSYGVLAHVAAADPALMACTRHLYDEAVAAKELLPDMAQAALRGVSSFDGFEVAALPEAVAPQWAATVHDAWHASLRELDRGVFSEGVPPGVRAWRPEHRAQHAREALKNYALWACTAWSREPLQFTVIQVVTRIVAQHRPTLLG